MVLSAKFPEFVRDMLSQKIRTKHFQMRGNVGIRYQSLGTSVFSIGHTKGSNCPKCEIVCSFVCDESLQPVLILSSKFSRFVRDMLSRKIKTKTSK